jgi:NAD(P)-dependent dehydrogenase (short-subunit alcohol dehydrogenase family)
MDIAIVTGAETPLGLRIIEGLNQQGCRVHGIGNNLSKVTYADRHFIAHAVDVSDLQAVQKVTSEILEKEGRLDILIHAVDVTPGAAFEKLPIGNLEAILKIGLLGPVMLTRLALPNLLRFRGQLINIIPANKSGHEPSAVNALIEGGLREMNTALFDHARDAGLRVTNLILRQNTVLPDGTVSDAHLEQTHIDPDQVARTIEFLLNANESNIPNEITLYPRLSAAATAELPENPLPIDPYNSIVLPPAEYCPPDEPKIPTKQADRVERTIPYSDEEMEEKIAAAIEDFDEHPERYESKQKKQRPDSNRDQSKSTHSSNAAPDGDDSNSKRRRGRRRGGRNRNRDQNDSSHPQPNQSNDSNQPHQSQKPAAQDTSNPANSDTNKKPNRNRRRNNSGRKPEHANETNQPSEAALKPVPEKPKNKPAKKPKESLESKPGITTEAKPAKKKVARKPVPKKASEGKKPDEKVVVKKDATKKVATKKAAKKTAVKKVAAKKVVKKAAKKAVKKRAAKPKLVE